MGAVTGLETEVGKARGAGPRFGEFLRSAALSVGVYVLPARAVDGQSPHGEDEIYYVVRGRGQFAHGSRDDPVGPGDVLFVPAREVHRFHAIAEELVLLVVFAPPEGPAASPGPP